jgi:predicted RNA-binding protein with TRAM domain
MQPPVEVGKVYEVEIESLLPGNRGLAKIDEFVIFVNNINELKKVKIKITKIARTYAEAEIKK